MQSFAHRGVPARVPRSRSIAWTITSLVVLLSLLVTTAPRQVEAAPPLLPSEADTTTFKILAAQVSDYPGQVCVGEKVGYDITVVKSSYNPSTGNTAVEPVNLASVTATVFQPDVLKMTTKSPRVAGYSLEDPGKTTFWFEGKSAGSVKIEFETMLPVGYLSKQTRKDYSASDLREMLYASTQVKLEVIECPLDFMVIDRQEISAGGLNLDMVGVVNWTQLKQVGEDGTTFEAQATKYIVVRVFVPPPCNVIISVAQRNVEIRAEKTSDGGYHVTYTQGPAVLKYTTSCPDFTGFGIGDYPDMPGTDFLVGAEGGSLVRTIPSTPGYKATCEARVRVHPK